MTAAPGRLDTPTRRARLRELAASRRLDAIVVYGHNGYASHLRYFASQGYCADLTRTFVVGTLSPAHQRMFAAVREAFDRAVEAVRPGAPINGIHLAARKVIDAAGFGPNWAVRIGHGIGLETSLEWPDLERETRALEPGMAFCIEPGVYIPGTGGIRLEDNVIVTPSGAELLSRYRRELIVVE